MEEYFEFSFSHEMKFMTIHEALRAANDVARFSNKSVEVVKVTCDFDSMEEPIRKFALRIDFDCTSGDESVIMVS